VTRPKRLLGVGDCDFAVDPSLPADRTPLVWLPHLDPGVVLVTPAPRGFKDASRLGITPTFERRAREGNYLISGHGRDRLSLLLINGAKAADPVAVVVPINADFARRADRALQLWRAGTGRPKLPPPDRLTTQRRKRLAFALRALDGHLADETYRTIAEVLFNGMRIPAGAGWKTHDLRDRTIRLVRSGVKLMRGGYLDLLRYPGRYRE